MANRDIVFGIRITGDSSSAVSEAQKVDKAFDDVSGGLKVVESAARSAESALGATMRQVTPQPMKEMAAATHGAADALDRVSAAHAGAKTLDQLGMTAGQTAQALRQLPMQFTDIFTSLAAGQPPMMVMLQQGGQLKDTFGGIAPAARAMGGYIAGLITPVTVAAASVGALAVAYYQGAAEGEAFRKTVVLSGNAAGVTADQLGVMAGRVGEVAGTISNAAEVLNKLAGTGKVAVGQIERVAAAIVAMGQVGADVDKLIEKFAAMGEEPVKASLKLNEAYNYLTPKIYDQIRALAEQNKHEEATKLAQEAAAKAMRARAAEVQAQAGTMEQAWMAVRKAAAGAWDAMLNVGRADSLAVQIEKQRQLISEISSGETIGNIDVAQKHLKALEQMAGEQEKAAKADADRAVGMRTYVGLEKDVTAVQERGIKQTRTLSEALAEYREKLANIKALNPDSAMLDPKKVAAGEAAIREEYKKTARVRTGLTQGERVTEDWVKRIQVLQAETGVTKELTETHKAGIKIMTDFANGKLKLTAAEKARLPALVQQALLLDDANEAEKRARAEAEAMAKVQAELLDAERKNTDTLLAKVEAAKFEADTYGMTEESVYRLLSARTQDRIEMLSFGDANDALIAELKAQAQAYLDLADAAGAKASREAAKKAADDSKAAGQRFADDIERALTDSLMRGFDAGKGFGQSFVDALKNTLKTTVLKATVQLVASPITSAIQSVYGASSAAANGIGNLSGAAGNSALTSAALGPLGGLAGAVSGLSSLAAGTSFGAFGAGMASGLASFGSLSSSAATLTAGASAGGAVGAGMMLGTVAPYLAAGLAIAQALGAFDGPSYHHGGAYVADTAGGSSMLTTKNYDGFDLSWGAYNSDRSAAFDEAMRSMSTGIAQQLAASIKQFGGDASGLSVASRFASDNSDYSVGALRVKDAAGQVVFDLDKHYAAQAEKGMQEFTADATRALIGALKATKLDDEFAAVFANVDPLTSSIESLNAALTQAAAIQQQTESIRSAIDSNFLAPADQLDAAFEKLGVSVPTTATAYEALVRAQDLTTSAGRDLAGSLLAAYPAWGQVQDAADQAAAAAQAQADAIASQAAGLQGQLDELMGNTAAIRERELAAIDPANRALQERIYALQDEAAALEAARAAASEAQQGVVDGLQGQVDALASQFGNLAPASRTVADALADTTSALSSLEDGLASLLGTAAQSPLDALKATLSSRDAIGSFRESLQSAIFDARLSGSDAAGQAALLRGQEASLWAKLQTSSDPVAVAGQLQQTLLKRISAEAAAAQAATDAQAKLAGTAREDQIATLRAQIDGMSRLRSLAADISQFVGSLDAGDLSPLAPGAQLDAARALYEQTLAAARAGDQTAQGQLTGNARAYLEEAKGYFASTAAYADVYATVRAGVNGVGATSPTEAAVATAQAQLDAIQAQGTDISTVAANSNLQVSALSALDERMATVGEQYSGQADQQIAALKEQIAALKGVQEGQQAQIAQAAARHAELVELLRQANDKLARIQSDSALAGAAA